MSREFIESYWAEFLNRFQGDVVLEPEKLPEQLEALLTDVWADGSTTSVTDFVQITGGYSRYMARFGASGGGESERFILRADPPPGQSILDTDRQLEWDLVRALMADGRVTIPAARFFDDGAALGAPAIVFDEIAGETLFVRTQVGEVHDHLDLVEPLADLAAAIHAVDVAVLPPAIERPTSWNDYIDAGAARWRTVEQDHIESDPFMRVIAAWLVANKPPPTELALVHGDFQAPNVLIEESTGAFNMLDWELAHVGDPREDLGWWALAHKSQPPDLIEADQQRFLARYRERTGMSEEVVNPATLAYFTVFAALGVFTNVIGATAAMARGQAAGASVAYMTNAIPFMHGVYIDAMQRAGAWRDEDA